VSSTSQDLEDYRAVARNVILELQWRPEMMEHFGAQPEPTVEFCYRAIERCNLMLLIVAWRQGWVPTVEQGGNGRDSITALELAHAGTKQIPVLALLASDSWPVSLSEDEEAKRSWVRKFRDGLNRPAAFFEYEAPTTPEATRLPGFRAVVRETLVKYKERTIAREEQEGPALDYFRSARDCLVEGTSIPVLGCGIYGEGPLSSQALVEALLPHAGEAAGGLSREQLPLATAAEYRERLDGSRSNFLKRFRKILERQAAEAAASPVLDLLAGLAQLPLIVSATYDRLLEQKLERGGRKYVVVSHVLRSREDEENGKVLLLRTGGAPDFRRADELRFEADELVLYKPQGSPFLHDTLDPNLEIDTVVVTETDHAMFLQRLASPETGVPKPLLTLFRSSPLLFLGYTMNVWQYRLMMLTFQSAGRQARDVCTLAVRVPDAEIEQVAWDRLKANLIRMDPNQFARSAGAAQGANG